MFILLKLICPHFHKTLFSLLRKKNIFPETLDPFSLHGIFPIADGVQPKNIFSHQLCVSSLCSPTQICHSSRKICSIFDIFHHSCGRSSILDMQLYQIQLPRYCSLFAQPCRSFFLYPSVLLQPLSNCHSSRSAIFQH